jgi:hypothetical protein
MSYTRNQFFYKRKEAVEGTDPQEFTEFTDSINLDKVIRSVQMSTDTIVVLLDDMHERIQEVPNINPKNNKVIGTKKKTQDRYFKLRHIYQEMIKKDLRN